MIQGLIPTAPDQVICAQDVALLQYVYSDDFTWHGFGWSTLLAILLKRFRVIFGAAIGILSLRHAMLSLAAALSPFPKSHNDIGEAHSSSARKALMKAISSQPFYSQ